MNKVLIRLKDISDDSIYELFFDERLSFKENLSMASSLIKKELNNKYIYDMDKNLFLDLDIPIFTFKMSVFPMFYLL